MSWIGDIITGLIEYYNTNDVLELCDCLGISIIQKELKNKSSFFYRNQYGDECIFIDSSVDRVNMKELIAHELGHAILHPEISIAFYDESQVNKNKLERQANIFAAELLMHGVNEKEHIWDGQTIKEFANCLKVSEAVVEYKFLKSGSY